MNHPTHKLDQAAAAAIRRAHATGRPVRALARERGVSLPTVRAVLRYARYRPALSEEQHVRLAALSHQLGCTRDEVLDVVFSEGMRAAVRRADQREGR